jgi:hypothetical protein
MGLGVAVTLGVFVIVGLGEGEGDAVGSGVAVAVTTTVSSIATVAGGEAVADSVDSRVGVEGSSIGTAVGSSVAVPDKSWATGMGVAVLAWMGTGRAVGKGVVTARMTSSGSRPRTWLGKAEIREGSNRARSRPVATITPAMKIKNWR